MEVSVCPIIVLDVQSLMESRLECQEDLSGSISKLNKNSRLFVIREGPQTLLPKLFKAWRSTHLVFEKDTDPYGRERDAEIIKLAKEAKVEVVIKYGRTLWDSDELVRFNGNKPTMTISQVQTVSANVVPKARLRGIGGWEDW